MKKTTLLLNTLLIGIGYSNLTIGQCAPGTAFLDMQHNNVNARLSTKGNFWEDPITGSAGYEVPSGSGLTTLYTGAFWIGGHDANGVIHLAADTYHSSGSDYWPGPIDEATLTPYNCQDFDRFWSMSRTEIDAFLTTGTPSLNITEWPGKNNPNLSNIPANQDLAPFVDVNNDGNYNPADGDYPAIKGDFAHWWALNDIGNVHTSTGADALGVEIHMMAYSFITNDDINNATFYDVEIINKSSLSYFDTYMGIFVDPDLGGNYDDYIGCDTNWNLGYAYNGDDLDESSGGITGYGTLPPVQGVTMLKRPTLDGVPASMTSFAGFTLGSNPATQDPTLPIHYYNYMRGKWTDGTDMVYGGDGHINTGGTQPFPYQFPGLPSDSTQWSECSEGNPPGDRRFVISFGSFNFHPNRNIELTFAAVYHRPTTGNHCEGIEGLLEATENVHNFYHSLPNYYNSVQVNDAPQIKAMPNPANDVFTLSELPENTDISVFDISGKMIINVKSISDKISLSTKDLPSGMYYVKIDSKNLKHTYKLVVEH